MSDRGFIPILLRSGQLSQSAQSVSSSGLTTYDLQFWNVITSSSELRFGCS